MYAVVQVGSSQFKVSEGDVIHTNRLPKEEGEEVTLEKVLMVSKGEDVQVGQPYLPEVSVTARVVKNFLGDKLVALHYRRRKDSSRKTGHRQRLTALNIVKIQA